MKSQPKLFSAVRLGARRTSLAVAAILAVSAGSLFAGAFTPGNLVVARVGDGTAALTSAGTEIFFDEITTAGSAVQSIALPTNGVSSLVASGSASSEGALTLSANNQYLVIAGYNTNAWSLGVASSTSVACPRGVATVSAGGTYSLAYTTSSYFSGNNIRSGAADGAGNVWGVGAASGLVYLGSGTPAAITGTVLNNRVLKAIGGNLYYSTGSGSRGILEITGTPASGSTATNYVIPTGTHFGTGSSPYDFVFSPDMNTAYVADSDEYTNSTTLGGVEKWTNGPAGFAFEYSLSLGTNGADGLAVDFSGSSPVIYATAASGLSVFKVVDTGAGSTGAVIATPAANEVYRGLSFAPSAAAPVIVGITPSSLATNAGSSVTFTVSATGTAPLSYYWYFETATATNLVSSGASPTLTFNSVQLANSGNYQVVVSNASLQGVTSSVVTLSVSGFAPKNLVVERLGNGSAALSAAGTPIFLDEFTTTGAGVQSVAVPTNGPGAFVDTGNSITEGMLSLTPNGQYLVLAGYATNAGVAGVAAATAASVPRAVGTVDPSGTFNLAFSNTTVYSTYNIRSATSDGYGNFWAVGSGGTAGLEGVYYFGNGTPAPLTGTIYNSRFIKNIGGNLYYATGSGSRGILEITGNPTSGSTATNYVIPTGAQFGTGSSPYDFVFSPDMTTAYVADSNEYTNNTTVGGVEKWTNGPSGYVFEYSLSLGTNGAAGLAVDFSGSNPIIYATAASGTTLFTIADTGSSATGTLLATAAANEAYRSVAFAPTNSLTVTPPVISGITPSSVSTNVGSTVSFTASVTGTTPLSYYWYFETATTTNLISGANNQILTLANVTTANSGNYQLVASNASSVTVTSSVVSLSVIVTPPAITTVTPASVATNAGSTVTFTVSATGAAPLSYAWYFETATSTNLISGATSATLTLANVAGANSGNYQVVVSNSSLQTATSSVVTLTVLNDPNIAVQPNSAYGLLEGSVQFTVTAAGTSPGYQWYQFDGTSVYTPLTDGVQSDGSVVSGSSTSTLTLTNLQYADVTNFVVVLTNVYGSATSSVASLLSVDTTATLTFWNFNNIPFNLDNPAPWYGVGTAAPVGSTYLLGTSPFAGSVDPNDGPGFGVGPTNFSWGTDNYPLTGGNKQNGVQFNVSTVGAKDIQISYDTRVSATASDYERLQYTTNGTTWLDYPTSSTFGGRGTTYLTFNYDLTGFPGVANNPNFGFRIVTEFVSTATYGINTSNNYVGTANTYGTAGTVTYDRVMVSGDALTNSAAPPVVSSFTNVVTADYLPVTLNFTVSDATVSPDSLTCSAQSLNTATVNPNFSFGGSGANRTLTITPNYIASSAAAAPILVTATDPSGNTTTTWFILTLTSVNQPPTNSLTSISQTNTIANSSLSIPFFVGDDRTPVSGLTYTVSSGNNTVVPTANVVISGAGTSNPIVTITPATNQLGVANISVTLNDNDSLEPRSTTATFAFMVRPNTNIVALDYFNYDNAGALDAISGGYWQHLSGNYGQLQAGNGIATVDTVDNTENLQAALLGAPYRTTNGGTLYSSYLINITDTTKMPTSNGSYITTFNDGSGVTGYYEDMVVVATNGAALGNYRVGILNSTNTTPTTAATAQMFPLDLTPGSNYIIVTSLVLSNGFSRIWVNPLSQGSYSVGDTTPAAPLDNISDFELRESGTYAGSVQVSYLKIGTTFDSVMPSLQVQSTGTNLILNWSDPTLGIQSATNVDGPYVTVPGATPPYTNSLSTNSLMFFRFTP